MAQRPQLTEKILRRLRSSWIGGEIESYAHWLQGSGYGSWRVYHQVLPLLRFGDYAWARGAREASDLPRFVDGFAKAGVPRPAGGGRIRNRATCERLRLPIKRMLSLILPPAPPGIRLPFARTAPGFFEYLHEERGLGSETIAHYAYHLGDFEDYLRRARAGRLRALSASTITGFIIESAKRLGASTMRSRCGCLRTFLHYLHREGRIRRDLSVGIESPQRYRLSDVPRAITEREVRRVLASVDRRSAAGRRDYAILLLLVTYGLRAREVVALMLEHIDWRRDRLRILERKRSHSTGYPLSTRIGAALLAYLRHGRPETNIRNVFLTARAPVTPLNVPAVSMLARRCLRRAGISIARPGSHTFRHTCVQQLVDAGFSLKAIGDYVGHRSPQSTEIYTKVAIGPMRVVAVASEEEIL